MSKLIKGKLQDKKVELKIFEGLHKGVMAKVNAIVVHQTGAPQPSIHSTRIRVPRTVHTFSLIKLGRFIKPRLLPRSRIMWVAFVRVALTSPRAALKRNCPPQTLYIWKSAFRMRCVLKISMPMRPPKAIPIVIR